MTRFATLQDLRNWVWEHSDASSTSADDIEAIADNIRSDPAFPGWERDCTEYLENLAPLHELIER